LLKSKLCSLCPPESVEIPAEFGQITVTAEEVGEQVQRLRSQFQSIAEKIAPIEQGDFVTVVSGDKTETLNTARPFIHAELATACLGKCVDDDLTDSDGTQWTITKVRGKILPAFDDCLAQKGGAESAGDFLAKTKETLVRTAKRNALQGAEQMLSQQLIENSTFALDEAELQQAKEELLGEITNDMQESEMPEELAAEMWLRMFDVPKPDERVSVEQAAAMMAEKLLKTILLGSEYLRQLGGELNEQTYEKEIARKVAKEGMTEEEARKENSYFSYLYEKNGAQVAAFASRYLKRTIEFNVTVED
jgi:FKBP-type peptidyl-prolyl cis-trans isomerase (trigger factor)